MALEIPTLYTAKQFFFVLISGNLAGNEGQLYPEINENLWLVNQGFLWMAKG